MTLDDDSNVYDDDNNTTHAQVNMFITSLIDSDKVTVSLEAIVKHSIYRYMTYLLYTFTTYRRIRIHIIS